MTDTPIASAPADLPPPPPPPPPTPAPKTSALAVAALVAGILGFCTLGLGSLVGLVLAIVALVRIGRSNGRLAGKGLAIGGLAASIVSLLFSVIVGGMLCAAFLARVATCHEMHAVECQEMSSCVAQTAAPAVHAMCRAAVVHAQHHDGYLPDAHTLPDSLRPYLNLDGPDADTFRQCQMNVAVSGVRLRDVPRLADTVLIWMPTAPGGGQWGLHIRGNIMTTIPDSPDVAAAVGFCDGHVEIMPRRDAERLLLDGGVRDGPRAAVPSPRRF